MLYYSSRETGKGIRSLLWMSTASQPLVMERLFHIMLSRCASKVDSSALSHSSSRWFSTQQPTQGGWPWVKNSFGKGTETRWIYEETGNPGVTLEDCKSFPSSSIEIPQGKQYNFSKTLYWLLVWDSYMNQKHCFNTNNPSLSRKLQNLDIYL